MDLSKTKNFISEKLIAFTEDKSWAERLYLTALGMYLIYNIWITTMMEQIQILNLILKYVPIPLFLLKMVLYDRYKMIEFLTGTFLLGLGVLIIINSGEKMPLFWFLILLSAKDLDFDRILRLAMIITGMMIIITIVGSLIGTVINLRYTRMFEDSVKIIRNSVGFIYPTDFGARIFYFMLGIFYLLRDKICKTFCLLGLIPTILVYTFSRAKLDSLCMLMLCVGYFGLSIKNSKSNKLQAIYGNKKIISSIICWAMPILAVVMLVLTMMYGDNPSQQMRELDIFLTHRLKYGYAALSEYKFTLFGQSIDMIGMGGTTVHPDNYNFVDCSYLYCYLKYGMIYAILVVGIYVCASYKKINDKYFLFSVLLIAINSMIAHHLAEVGYVIFMINLMTSKYNTVYCEQR